MKDNWLNTDLCTGCGACADKCPLGCISMIDDNGCLKPDIDIDKCVNCNQCKKVCPNFTPSFNAKPAECTYVAFYKDTKCSIKSSSGGLFVALAKYILAKQGIVYGAAMVYDNQVIECRHIRVEDEKDLYLLQGTGHVEAGGAENEYFHARGGQSSRHAHGVLLGYSHLDELFWQCLGKVGQRG